MAKKKFYITTPIYYVNAKPHIGHAYTTIVADCLARYYRSQDQEVYFLTGTDEHGQKIQRAAEELELSPLEFTNQIAPKFKELWELLEISNDDFIRTTEHRHIEAVQEVLRILKDNDNLYEGEYGGWYCIPCETFWTEEQLVDKKCPDCQREVEFIKEKNYFFKLSQYQDWLIQYLKDHPDFIFPQTRYNEVLSFLENNKLNDLCISRPKSRLNWGIPIPFDEEHVTYVWFDALINYLSAIGFVSDKKKFEKLWPAEAHIMAKDIIRQHAIYWPCMLKAMGLDLPKRIIAHGWWKIGEVKMSKSIGNVVDPIEMVEQYGVDSFRYFLMRDVNFGTDGNFSTESFELRFNSDLANDLGNLVFRTLNMIEKYFGDNFKVNSKPKFPKDIDNDTIRDFLKGSIQSDMKEDFGDYNFTAVLDKIWDVIKAANRFVEQVKPWNLKKEEKDKELLDFLSILIATLRYSADKLSPFMPKTTELIHEQISGKKIQKGKPLFPRLESAKK